MEHTIWTLFIPVYHICECNFAWRFLFVCCFLFVCLLVVCGFFVLPEASVASESWCVDSISFFFSFFLSLFVCFCFVLIQVNSKCMYISVAFVLSVGRPSVFHGNTLDLMNVTMPCSHILFHANCAHRHHWDTILHHFNDLELWYNARHD